MQVIEMRMRHQHRIDRRQVAHAEPRPPQPLQNKNPLREVRINHDVFSADLQEKSWSVR